MYTRSKLAHLVGAKPAQRMECTADPTEYADLLFGVGSATSVGPCLPAGSIHPSPETLEKDNGGYLRNQPIVGFGHAYISGSGGIKCYGNFLLSPTVDKPEWDSGRRAAFAVPGCEQARCYEYRVQLENGIHARVTPAHDAAIHAFSFPAGKEAFLLMDAARKMDLEESMQVGSITVDPARRQISGGGTYTGNWNGKEWNMYFAMEVDSQPVAASVMRDGDELPVAASSATTVRIDKPCRLGAYFSFGRPAESALTVKAKVAISFVSEEQAKTFLRQQIPAFDYDAIKLAAQASWRTVMQAIRLKTENEDLLSRFYTAMYHMNIQPRDRTGDHGYWDDFHTVWDSWKTVFPMYSLLYPEKMATIVESFMDRASRNLAAGNGIVLADQFMTAREGVAGQGGNDIENVIVDAYLKGVTLKNYHWEDVYGVVLRSAEQMRTKSYVETGYAGSLPQTASGVDYTWRFRPGSATLGFAFNDKAVAAMAAELGTPEEYARYASRSRSWRTAWNFACESEGFWGFPQARMENGDFDPDFNPHGGYNSHFYEATAWDASYINYNDVSGLVEAMGGAEMFTRRLLWACEHSVHYYNDDHGKEGYLNFTNEPSFHIPWLFCTDEIRRPDLAAKCIDRVIKRFSLPHDYPGDEDNGGMSSYYIFLMCGIFPYATTENYYLHGTRLEEIVFRLGNGRELRITGENVGGDNIYVQSATWQGSPLRRCKLTHSQLLEGGELHFVMGSQPSLWGR